MLGVVVNAIRVMTASKKLTIVAANRVSGSISVVRFRHNLAGIQPVAVHIPNGDFERGKASIRIITVDIAIILEVQASSDPATWHSTGCK